MNISGTTGDDILNGTADADLFKVTQGGNDTVNALDGNDTLALAGTLTAQDRIDGGLGDDTVTLGGNYAGANALVFGDTTIANVEQILLRPGSYDITTADANVAAGELLVVSGTALLAGNSFAFDGSAELDGNFLIKGGAGGNIISTGAGHDAVTVTKTGDDTISTGGGNDVISFATTLTAADHVDGGSGIDRIVLGGDYSGAKALTLAPSYITGIEQFFLRGAHNYTLTTAAGIAPALDLSLDARGSSGTFIFDGSAETTARFRVYGGTGDDLLSGGAQRDVFDIKQGGADTVHGGGGDDVVNAGAALKASDVIDGGAGRNGVVLDGEYAGLTLNANHLSHLNEFDLIEGHHYIGLAFVGDVTSGQRLVVDGSASAQMIVDLHAATSNSYWITGGGGDDIVDMGAQFGKIFSFDGGAGSDTVAFTRDFIAAGTPVLTFSDALFHNVEQLTFGSGTKMTGLTVTGDISGGAALSISLAALSASSPVTVDVHNSAASRFFITGGKGDDTFVLGDKFDNSIDTVNGGLGDDTLSLNGQYSLGLSSLTSVEKLLLLGAHSYQLETVDSTVAAGATLTVDASALDAAHLLQFDGDAETDGFFNFVGGAENDVLSMGGPASFAGSTIDGGGGDNTLALHGNYSAGFTFVNNIANIATLTLEPTGNYNLTMIDANVAAGQFLLVQGGATLTFDGSAETDGYFDIEGALHTSTLTGSSNADVFGFDQAGSSAIAIVHGGGGDDHIDFTNNFVAADSIDGGAGNDVLHLDGGYAVAVVMNDTTFFDVEKVLFDAGHTYKLTSANGNVAAGQILVLDAAALTSANGLTWDGSAELDGAFQFFAGAGNDVLTGGAGADVFDVDAGGNDTVHGGGGNDAINIGAKFTPNDNIDGGSGNDTLTVEGAVSVTFSATTLTNVETLNLFGHNNYTFVLNEGNVAAGATLTIDATALDAAHKLTLTGSNETDGSFVITDGEGNDVLTGGGQGDTFNLFNDGNNVGHDTAFGGGGNDIFNMGFSLTAADRIDGGAGNDVVNLNGDYASGVTFGASTLTGIETLKASGAFDYMLTVVIGNVAAGQSMTVDASAVTSGDFFNFNGIAETLGAFAFLDGAGNDTLTGGSQADTFDLSHGGINTVRGSSGADMFTSSVGAHADIFVYGASTESEGGDNGYDTIANLNFATDKIRISSFASVPTAIDTAVTTGSLSDTSFADDLIADVGAGRLGAHHAVRFTADAGTLSGQTFLVVDINGTAGYQTSDLVIHLTGAAGTLVAGDFT